jgi:all-trans-retinol 13,14-reductase
MDERFDAVVIGSGLGGLTVAALLSRLKKKRVLVLERHHTAGGFTHEFGRPGGFLWDVGLHYVGEVGPEDMPQKVFRLIGDGSLHWSRMPDPYERYIYPDFSVDMPYGVESQKAALKAKFPTESASIDAYYRDLKKVLPFFGVRLAPRPVAWMTTRLFRKRYALAMQTTEAYLAHRFSDPKLRAVVTSFWGDYGLPPKESSFAVHALLALHYSRGAYYPVGGGQSIFRSIKPVIEASGGEVRTNHEAIRIVVEQGRAVGVEVRIRRRGTYEFAHFKAPIIVSDAGARATFGRLLKDVSEVADLRAAIEPLPEPPGCVSLYLGLTESPSRLGLQGENLWVFDGYDHDVVLGPQDGLLKGRPHFAYISFPSLKDPEAKAHTVEILSMGNTASLASFADTQWRQRGPEYEAVKARAAEGLLALAERAVPGLGSLVKYQEVATPLSVEHFLGHPNGAIYGLPMTPERYRISGLGPRTPVRGLYLTGADAGVFGIVGALMTGVSTCAHILGPLGYPTIFSHAEKLHRASVSSATNT